MIISLEPLDGERFEVDFDPFRKVKELKEKIISEVDSDFSVNSIKLIYQGNVLSNEYSLRDYKYISGKSIVVVMFPAQKVSTSQERYINPWNLDLRRVSPCSRLAPQPVDLRRSANSFSTSAPEPMDLSDSGASAPQPAQAAPIAAPLANQGFPPVDVDQKMVKNIMELGYAESQVVPALRAAYNDGNRAVEFLLRGMPLVAYQCPPRSSYHGPPTSGTNNNDPARDPLALIRAHQHFKVLKQIAKKEPKLRRKLLQQMRRCSPALFRAVAMREEEFFRMLDEPEFGNAGDAEALGAIAGSIFVSEDEAALESLNAMARDLGYTSDNVSDAFVLCEKNEDLAVALILADLEEKIMEELSKD